ncbi:hypothetical protein VFPBJ_01944 [Purpureocillium lilacinum]|uniref:Uncharacterized protein n=1 Tax=Purpureocillium lilacinum TaxID=33203 RepID=A0A179HEJ3_PURLI|nr:hypothetical protein VFPBJ_01944 [Purpureocillium lilacinum]
MPPSSCARTPRPRGLYLALAHLAAWLFVPLLAVVVVAPSLSAHGTFLRGGKGCDACPKRVSAWEALPR